MRKRTKRPEAARPHAIRLTDTAYQRMRLATIVLTLDAGERVNQTDAIHRMANAAIHAAIRRWKLAGLDAETRMEEARSIARGRSLCYRDTHGPAPSSGTVYEH